MEKEVRDQDLGQVSDSQEKKEETLSYETYRKTVAEAKRERESRREAQSRVDELSEKLKSYEQQKLESKGQQEEVIKQLRSELGEVKGQYASTKKNYAFNILSGQIKSEAMKQGCVNPDKLIRLMPEEDLKGIEIGDDFQINTEDLSRVIAKAKEDNSDIGLFGVKNVNVNDIPAGRSIPAKKTLEQMTSSELQEYARQTLR